MDKKYVGQEIASGRSNRSCVLLAFIDLRNPEPLRQAAQALQSEMPGSQILCINTPATRVIEGQMAGIDRWITYGEGGANPLLLLEELRKLKPAAVCILYRSRKPKAHLKLEILAALVGGRSLFGAFPLGCRAGVARSKDRHGGPRGLAIPTPAALSSSAGIGVPALQLRRLSRPGLWIRVVAKTLLMLTRSAAAGVLAAIVGVVLTAAAILARPGERLGKPAAGQPR